MLGAPATEYAPHPTSSPQSPFRLGTGHWKHRLNGCQAALEVGLDLHDSIKMMANRRARVTRAFDKALSKRILASAHDVPKPGLTPN